MCYSSECVCVCVCVCVQGVIVGLRVRRMHNICPLNFAYAHLLFVPPNHTSIFSLQTRIYLHYIVTADTRFVCVYECSTTLSLTRPY